MKTVESGAISLKSLIIRAGLGDVRAFESIVQRFYRIAFGYAHSLVGDYHFAEDAVQEAFIEAYRSLGKLRHPEAFYSWFRLIVFKQCDRIKRKRRRPDKPYNDELYLSSPYETQEKKSEKQEQLAKLQSLLAGLTDKQRQVTSLYFMDGFSQIEIARFLDLKPSTVRKRLFDSKKKLFKELHMNTENEAELLIRHLFSNRISDKLLQRLLANPSKLQMKGETRNLTVLFADAIKVTARMRGMSPEEGVEYLNESFTVLADAIIRHDGFLDKFIGDAIMALWGTPVNAENHATNACLAALEMQSALIEANQEWEKKGWPKFQIRIGVNSGDAIIGNFGPPDHLLYTPMGDTINVGARFEGLCKEYGVGVLIGENTRNMAGDSIVVRELDEFTPRYAEKSLTIYELVGDASKGVKEETEQMLSAYNQGLSFYREGNCDQARRFFLRSLELSAGCDKPSIIYLDKCLEDMDHC